MSDSCHRALSCDPNATFIIAGDVNQLDLTDFMSHHALRQMVKISPRGHNILDVFLIIRISYELSASMATSKSIQRPCMV